MRSLELANVLELIRGCREALAAGRVAEATQLVTVAEQELADLMVLDAASVDRRHSPTPNSPPGIHAHARYSGPFRRRTDSPQGHHSR